MEFIYEPEFWVAVSFFIFIGVLVYLGVHKKVANELDARALRISKELEEARRPSGRGRKAARRQPSQAGRRRHGGGQHQSRSLPGKLRPLPWRHASH
jgi:Mitochondrial ATP synthase B chain precursor (ATP-synt_B)